MKWKEETVRRRKSTKSNGKELEVISLEKELQEFHLSGDNGRETELYFRAGGGFIRRQFADVMACAHHSW